MNSEELLKYLTFDTPRLSIQPVDTTSLKMLTRLYGCSKTMRYIAIPFTLLQTENMLNTMLKKQKKQQCDSFILHIKHKTSLIDFGISGIPNIDFVTKKAEIGVMLLPNGYGKGIAVEVARALVVKLIALDFETIYMDINPENKAAIIGANKVGFTATDSLSRYVYQQAA